MLTRGGQGRVAAAAGPYPDFLRIAAGYRIGASRVRRPAALEAGLKRLLLDPSEPFLLDVIVERESNVLLMIPAGKTYRDVVLEKGLAAIADT